MTCCGRGCSASSEAWSDQGSWLRCGWALLAAPGPSPVPGEIWSRCGPACGCMGLPNLSAKGQLAVDTANAMASCSAALLRLCGSLGVPAVLENPHTSRMWSAPCLQQAISSPGARSYVTDFCGWQCCWRKRTRFLAVWCDLAAVERHCVSSGGRCSFSKKPHVQLRGWIGSRWATSVAEPYPKSLCQRLALELVQAVRKRNMAPFLRIGLGTA